MTELSPAVLSEAFHDLIVASLDRILEREDPDDFLAWLGSAVAEMCEEEGISLESAEQRAFVTTLGRAIWNATPLPGNDFRPRPLPAPGRNDPCPCGSGTKFKRCCANGPPVPSLAPNEIWPIMISRLGPSQLDRALSRNQAPIEALVALACDALEEGRPKAGVRVIEPLFEGELRRFDEIYDDALTTLCNLYDDLGYERKKMALLERIVAETPPSPLRSGAHQRLACIAMDAGDTARAWSSFRNAQQDDPEALSLCYLEIQLLLADSRPHEARERARFWLKRLRRQGAPDDYPSLAFLEAVAKDPTAAMAELGMQMAGGAGLTLAETLRGLEGRPVPNYRVAVVDGPGAEASREEAIEDVERSLMNQLRGMGIPEAERQRIARDLIEGMEEEFAIDPDDLDDDDPLEDIGEETAPDEEDVSPACRLVAPTDLAAVEAAWHEVFPLDKPFGTHPVPHAEVQPWEPGTEAEWTTFLASHSEAFDSFDVLDDLATAVELHPMAGVGSVDEYLQRSVLDRAEKILRAAVEGETRLPRLEWADPYNRPALRCLMRGALLALEAGDLDAAVDRSKFLLALNPADNHGMRGPLINTLLRRGLNEHALEVASQFPDDLLAETQYGAGLALVRLGRTDDALATLQAAASDLPETARYLLRKRAAKPKLSPHGITIGGKDQAWFYREEMRDVWLETPDALDLLGRACKLAGVRRAG